MACSWLINGGVTNHLLSGMILQVDIQIPPEVFGWYVLGVQANIFSGVWMSIGLYYQPKQ